VGFAKRSLVLTYLHSFATDSWQTIRIVGTQRDSVYLNIDESTVGVFVERAAFK